MPRPFRIRTIAALLTLPALVAPLSGCGGTEAPSPAEGRSLATPPDLQVGEWWTVEVDPVLVGVTIPTTLVVTHREGDQARIGIPPGEFSHDFLVLHVPVLGDLDLSTFAWRVMWDDFEALRFPLEVGRTWTADFHGYNVEAEVTRVEGDRAFITMIGEEERIEMTYDARMGMITEFREEALLLGFRVTGHGFGYEGAVLDPAGIQLGIMHGGPSTVAGHHGGDAGTETATLMVDSPGSHGSLNLVVWNRGQEDEAGSYRITATAPDGTVFEKVFELEPGAPSVAVESFGHDAVQGEWRLDFHRGGPAGLLVELFTYDLRERLLGR